MKPGNLALIAASLLFVVTAWAALSNVDNRDGIHCGSWLSPNDYHARLADDETGAKQVYGELRDAIFGGRYRPAAPATEQVEACASARSGQLPLIVVCGVLTLALLIVGVLRRYQPKANPQPGGSATP